MPGFLPFRKIINLRGSIMKLFSRIALVGTGLVALSLSAHAVGTPTATDTATLQSTTTKPIQLTQKPDPSQGIKNKKPKKRQK
jgi:hypothetical protein